MKARLMMMVGAILLMAVIAGCSSTGSIFTLSEGELTAKERAFRAAAAAHPEGPPYTYTWTEDVMIDGTLYTKQGSALVTQ